MDADVLFAGIAVGDFAVARAWYERFFGRAADVTAHDSEVMWQVTERGWLYIVGDPEHAGHGAAAVAVPDLERALAELAGRGVIAGPVEQPSEGARKATVRDPDGNSIAVIEVSGRAG